MDIRLETALVIQRGGEYLVGKIVYSNELRWSVSIYDAWRTRSRESARKLADYTGGDLVLFNPIVGQRKELKEC